MRRMLAAFTTLIGLGAYAPAVSFFLGQIVNADTLVLRDSAEGHPAEVYFHNDEMRKSVSRNTVMSHNGVEVRVRVEVHGGGTERITVEPVSPDFVAVPWQAEVEDGNSVTVQIMRAGGLS
jgi:hypothetical protein